MNPHIRAFSPILCLSTQVGEKSPSWGFHPAMVTGAARLVSSCYASAVRVNSVVGDHPNLPADGQEDGPMAITDRHQIRQSTHGNAAPNAHSGEPRSGPHPRSLVADDLPASAKPTGNPGRNCIVGRVEID